MNRPITMTTFDEEYITFRVGEHTPLDIIWHGLQCFFGRKCISDMHVNRYTKKLK